MINYLICSTQRSGSSYLSHLLRATGELGRPGELFGKGEKSLKKFAAKHRVEPSELAVAKFVSEKWRSTNGVFGLKMHYHQYLTFCANVELRELFGGMNYLYVDRKDVVMQAVSLYKARNSGAWSSSHKSQNDVSYDYGGIMSCLNFLNEEKAKWEAFFSVTGVRLLRVYYEALEECPDIQVRQVYKYLGLPNTGGEALFFDVTTQKQRDEESYKWADRFCRDMKNRMVV